MIDGLLELLHMERMLIGSCGTCCCGRSPDSSPVRKKSMLNCLTQLGGLLWQTCVTPRPSAAVLMLIQHVPYRACAPNARHRRNVCKLFPYCVILFWRRSRSGWKEHFPFWNFLCSPLEDLFTAQHIGEHSEILLCRLLTADEQRPAVASWKIWTRICSILIITDKPTTPPLNPGLS